MIFYDRIPLTLSLFSVKTKILQNQFTTFIKNINEKQIYIYIYKVNDKEYYFFRNSEFHAACATIFSRKNYNGHIFYNIMVSYFKWHHSTKCRKIPFTPVKGIHVNNDEKEFLELLTIWFTVAVKQIDRNSIYFNKFWK